MTISSRTPEGEPNYCPICGRIISIDPSQSTGDAPCPNCGNLLWWFQGKFGGPREEDWIARLKYFEGTGVDLLDFVEIFLEVEEEFGLTVSDEDARKLKTLGEIIKYLAKK